MAIRIGHQPGAYSRLVKGWVRGRNEGSVTAQLASAQVTAERLVRAPFNWGWRLVADVRRGIDIKYRVFRRKYAQLKQLEDKFEQMVDLMCWAAQNVPDAAREQRYLYLRTTIRSNYSAMKKHLRPALIASSPSDHLRDPFDSLVCAESLQDAVNSDRGIDDIIVCRLVLDQYRRLLDHASSSI